ncbi:PREDICTED: uncharacterized protein LOC104608156 isoform X2 [Nelumbo nucifera]|uniref:Uncharacterized protein LOC104608156 isoform X2 n=1 Tax=Nelumbo nucifera TaxID=4432 RepID=A0A1U8B7U6_NELNU|nr:PREDICTED: uncharacterized protein LOC104608156 isoform X2 [Nelumbo nucifera]
MGTEVHEMPNGWPLGLENMSTRLRVLEYLQAAVAEESSSFHMYSTSFSSFSSSELDTESTRSFFQDHSVSLGRLIGIRPGVRGDLHFTNTIHSQEHEQVSVAGSSTTMTRRREMAMSEGICIPLLLNILVKINPSRNNSKH